MSETLSNKLNEVNNNSIFDYQTLEEICSGFEDTWEGSDLNVQKYVPRKSRNLDYIETRFPNLLYSILQSDDHSHIISWMPNGRAFIIQNLRNLEADVLPLYFKTSKLKSFQKQLNIYGYKRTKLTNKSTIYHHDHFIQHNPELLLLVARVKVWPRKRSE